MCMDHIAYLNQILIFLKRERERERDVEINKI